MPRKPSKQEIERGKRKLNSHDVIQAIINEEPMLREAVSKDYANIFGKAYVSNQELLKDLQ